MARWMIVSLVSLAAVTITATPARSTSCTVGPYIVFFDAGNAYLTKESREILENVSNMASDCGYGRTLLAGHTDTKEEANLARRRTKVVRAYLSAHGIPNTHILEKVYGANRQRIATGRNVSERQNRRVEILVSQP